MALLDAATRQLIAAAIQRVWSERRETVGFTKADLQAAADATDAWIDANAASYNAALPAAFRTSATAGEKTLLFCYVALKRSGEVLPRES